MRSFSLYALLLFVSASFFFWGVSSRAFAATCSISSDTTIDSTYVESNSCDAIVLSGTPAITWSGTIDAGRPVAVSVNGGTSIFSGVLTLDDVASSVVVASGATVTHAAEDKTGVQILAQTVTISGNINTSAKGCGINKGVNGSGDCATSNPGAPGNSYGGAGHGGVGGSGYYSSGGATYGSSTNPTLLGSGGGPGGAGGGRVGLTVAGTLTINGTVSADGGAGGGSGGSVYVTAAVLNGSGVVSANGGNGVGGCDGQGNGGGGRIAMYYDAGDFAVSDVSAVTVADGTSSCTDSRNGTTYILDRRVDDGGGNLVFNGGGLFHAGGDFIRNSITVTPGSDLKCDSALTSLTVSTTQPINWSTVVWACAPTAATSFSLTSNGSLTLSDLTATFAGSMGDAEIEGAALTTSNVVWSISGADTLAFNVPAFSNAVTSTLSMTKAGSRTTFNTSGPLTLNNFVYNGGVPGTSALGGHLFFPSMTDLTFVNTKIYANVSNTLSSFSLDANSLVSATGKGCQAGYGPDASNVCTSATAGAGSHYGGAGHGGVGGTGYVSGGGATYGSSTYPSLFGSGQGPTAGSNYPGGRILLAVSGALTLNGSLSASASGLGGSGGSIYVRASSIAGSGSLAAVGGNGDEFRGPGGGGRIALIYSQMTFAGALSVAQGTGTNNDAGVGTIYTFQSNASPDAPSLLGPTALVNSSTTGTNTPIFHFILSDPDGADTDAFRIQIDDSADFGSPVVDYTSVLGAQGERSFQVGQATGGGSYSVGSSGQALTDGTYFWQVKAIDAAISESAYATANGGYPAFIVDTEVRTIEFLSASGAAIESVTATSIKIVLNTLNFQDVTVAYAVTGGTATGGGEDYTLASGTANIVAGQTSTTISLAIVNDQIDEPNETIVVTLSSPSGAVLGAETAYTYTIIDNDVAGVTVTESAGSSNVAEGGATDTFTISLDTPPTLPVLIAFATTTYGVTLSTSTVAFTSANWNVPVTVTVTATDDAVDESTHAGSIISTISTPSGSVYGYSGTPPVIADIAVSITDNDTAGVRLSVAELSVTEGGQVESYQAYLSTAPTTTVTVTAVPDDDQVIVTPALLTFTPVNWNVPQLFQVGTVNDTVYEVTRGSRIVHRASSEGLVYNAELVIGMIEVETLDNDTAGGGGVGVGLAIPLPAVPVTPVPLEDSTGPVLPPLEPSSGEVPPTPQTYQVIDKDVAAYRVVLPATDRDRLADFVENGISEQTIALGSGERAALLRDLLETTGKVVSNTDLIRTANGQIPLTRNLSKEQALQPRALTTFRRIYGHAPNFKDAEENLAWNTLMYRIRFPRDLAVEKQGIQEFKKLFGRTPSDPFQWATVRVLGYID